MTREEAIANLKMIRVAFVDVNTAEQAKLLDETFNVAIKALEQEPCEDAISRQAVLDLIEHHNSDGLGSVFYGYEEGVKFANAVNKLSPVNPQPKAGHWEWYTSGWHYGEVSAWMPLPEPYKAESEEEK